MTKIFHKENCKRIFKRYDLTCPRCLELSKGAKVRGGWVSREADDFKRTSEIVDHFASEKHKSGQCGIICTYGDW